MAGWAEYYKKYEDAQEFEPLAATLAALQALPDGTEVGEDRVKACADTLPADIDTVSGLSEYLTA